MAAEPPRDGGGVPGYLMVMAAVSVLIFLFALAVGLIGFGIIDVGGDDAAPTAVVADGDLQASGFTSRDSRLVENRREIDAEVSVTNTGDETLKNSTVIVQCLDGGFVSDSALIVSIAPDQTLTMQLTLTGTGNPGCAAPIIDFDTP